MDLVEALCHESFYGTPLELLTADKIFRRTVHNTKGWKQWLKGNQISEKNMEKLIKLITNTVERLGLESTEPRLWSAMFHESAVPDSKWGADYFPDLVLLKLLEKAANDGRITWKDIMAVMEIKASAAHKADAERQIARYVQCIFNAQPGRRFVIALIVLGTMVTLWIFDRSGAICCEPFDMNDQPERFLRIILSTLYMKEEHLGYDHTIYRKPGNDEDLFITVDKIEYKIKCIYQEPGIKGRGTTCYEGETLEKKSRVVIKDSWVDAARERTEVEILEELNAKPEEKLSTPDGVRVIPKIVAHEIVKTHRPCPIGGKEIEVNDSTSIFREHLVEVIDGKQKWAWTSKEKKDKTEIRHHYRVVMTPFGSRLENFESMKGLMRAFRDIVHALRILHEARVLHRDISYRNILLHMHEGQLRGLLIDYDYAVSLNRTSSEAIAERTGTVPFMAIDRLEDKPDTAHCLHHDLESLYYVLCWMSTLYAGPHNLRRPFVKSVLPYRKTAVAVWNGEGSDNNSGFQSIQFSKSHYSIPKNFRKMLEQFSPYFRKTDSCMKHLRRLLFEPKVDLEDPDDAAGYEAMKSRLMAALSKCKSSDPSYPALVKDFERIPIVMRPPEVILHSFCFAFEKMEDDEILQDEVTPKVDTEGDIEYQEIGPRHLRDLNEYVVPGVAEDIELGGEAEETLDESIGASMGNATFSGTLNLSLAASSTKVNSASYQNKRKTTEDFEAGRPSLKRSKNHPTSGVLEGKLPRISGNSGKRISGRQEFETPTSTGIRRSARLKTASKTSGTRRIRGMEDLEML
ncbi:hypothetical protein SCHPADRAFT_930373 [Schizopora paradoxa]|uniref:Protein kinase domain-containing protein n=1 Tax=Schizopora paradoxa TaxID=27342 RepID=A0A0H2S0X4_9AGAM|nr:hypothetical protein SCHPADRAFT_930373 [Schizopora paradoxa]